MYANAPQRKDVLVMSVKTNITAHDEELLSKVTDTNFQDNAFNIRKNGKLLARNITENVKIITKEDGSGIDIIVKENTEYAIVMIPVILSLSGLTDTVKNDFYIGENANVTIIAGCAVKSDTKKLSTHIGIHRFFVSKNSKVKYVEKHYGSGCANYKSINPTTEITLEENAKMEIETVQIEGVDTSTRITKALLKDKSTLTINEKIMTNNTEEATTNFEIDLEGIDSSCHVTSRAVSADNSTQKFISVLNGNNKCYGHVECDAILKDSGKVFASPTVNAKHAEASLVHEATIGKIAGEQLMKLMSLGLNEKEAEKEIINGFLK